MVSRDSWCVLDLRVGRPGKARMRPASDSFLQLVLNSIPIAVFWKDLDSRFLGCNQRFAEDASFAKIEMCALVELGIHNPLAATVGLKGEGEWTLAKELLGSLPKRSLLIVDRLYGCGKVTD